MEKKNIYHGCQRILEVPIYGKGKSYADFGSGFYCTRYPEAAKEWACRLGKNGFANQYALNTEKLNILDLTADENGIRKNTALLVNNRLLTPETEAMEKNIRKYKEEYLPDLKGTDVIIGYRADDSWFSFLKAFLNETLSLSSYTRILKMVKTTEQLVLISPAAFAAAHFVSCAYADAEIYYPKRQSMDISAREIYRKIMQTEEKGHE